MDLKRFSGNRFDITAEETPLALDVKQIESYDDPGPLPDLAIDPEDIPGE